MNTLDCTLEFDVLGLQIEMPVKTTYLLGEAVDVRSVRLCGEQMLDRLDPRQLEALTRQVLAYEGVSHD